MNDTILSLIDDIAYDKFISEMEVLDAMSDLYDKQSAIMEYASDISSFNYIMEGDDSSSKDSKKKDGPKFAKIRMLWHRFLAFFQRIGEFLTSFITNKGREKFVKKVTDYFGNDSKKFKKEFAEPLILNFTKLDILDDYIRDIKKSFDTFWDDSYYKDIFKEKLKELQKKIKKIISIKSCDDLKKFIDEYADIDRLTLGNYSSENNDYGYTDEYVRNLISDCYTNIDDYKHKHEEFAEILKKYIDNSNNIRYKQTDDTVLIDDICDDYIKLLNEIYKEMAKCGKKVIKIINDIIKKNGAEDIKKKDDNS